MRMIIPPSPIIDYKNSIMAEEAKAAETILAGVDADEQPTATAGYVAPVKVSQAELMQKDADDEALNKYKASLLGTDTVIVGNVQIAVSRNSA